MNYEQSAAELGRFLKVVEVTRGAHAALLLASQVHDALTAEQGKLAEAREELAVVRATIAAERANIAAEQDAHAAAVQTAREHVAAAHQEIKRAEDERAGVLAAMREEAKQVEAEHRATVSEDVRLAKEAARLFLLDAEAAEKRVADAQDKIKKLLGA